MAETPVASWRRSTWPRWRDLRKRNHDPGCPRGSRYYVVAEFAHLHLHSEYSLLDGAIRIADLFPRVQALGMDTVAVTDHGNLFGALELYRTARRHGVKLVFGCETYIASTDRFDRTNRRNYHLILLAKNEVGYHNLSYLNSMGYLEGLYYNPRIDKQLLREHAAGLVGMSACLGGEVAQTLAKHGVAAADEVAKEYASIFAPGDFFLELMPTDTPEQQELNGELRRMGPRLGIPLVATNDCHYVERADAAAHDVLMAIQTGRSLRDDTRLRHRVDTYYIKSPSEMNGHFRDTPEALENTVAIAKRCNVELKLGTTYLPKFAVPDGETEESHLRTVVVAGLTRRLDELRVAGKRFDPDLYRERAGTELAVICEMRFAGYFLIVWDFIRWAKDHGIPVGPGRGSGAGSVVAWAMRITDIDPLEFKLVFERFLNPDRVSMPDFDVDFCMKRRDEVIRYVQEKYGKERVAQIATFHQLKARGVIRDIAKTMDMPLAEADRIAKLVPEQPPDEPTWIRKAIEMTPELRELYERSAEHRELLDIASKLEGLNRHAGMHAAGVVITERPVWDHVPCFKGHGADLVTQFDKDAVEKAGLVKFDFLGLKTLTVIRTAVELINEQRARAGEPAFDLDAITRDDAAVYRNLSRGDTTGVFQMESSGMRAMLRKLRPDCLEDLVAAVALYRPGPLNGGMVDDFIARKRGERPIEHVHPALAPILTDTYGVIVYQEQVMEIARVLAGYSLGKADLLRRAMGKKDAGIMASEHAGFVSGAIANGVNAAIAEGVFRILAEFAEYGFNRSHSAAYAWLAYQTAYLKHHHPLEFFAGLLTCAEDTAETVKLVTEARALGLAIGGPDVDRSAAGFTIDADPKVGKLIRFGLAAVHGVGDTAVAAIVAARKEGGVFRSLDELCRRVDLHRCNARVLEALIKAGALDDLGAGAQGRASLLASVEAALQTGAAAARDRRSGQTSLFAAIGVEAASSSSPPALVSAAYGALPWSVKDMLAREKEVLGFYLTGHPVEAFASDLVRLATGTVASVTSGEHREGRAVIGGIVRDYRELITKKGSKMAVLALEDLSGVLPAVCFPDALARLRRMLVLDEPLLCTGKVKRDARDNAWKLEIQDAQPLVAAIAERARALEIHIDAEHDQAAQIDQLAETLRRSARGATPVLVCVTIPGRSQTQIALPSEYDVTIGSELMNAIDLIFLRTVARIA